jgi:cytochrome P450
MAIAAAAERPASVLSIDPFSDEFLTEPYPFHEQMREAGAVVQLDTYDIFGMARYADVHAALNDWQTFSSARGVGIEDFAKVKSWRPPSMMLETDPPAHDKARNVMAPIFSTGVMRRLRDAWLVKAIVLIEELLDRREFDAIEDLAMVFPLRVFPDAVGLRKDGRENLLPFGNMVFNSFGPKNALFHDSIAQAEPVLTWINDQCRRDALAPGGFGSQIFAAVNRGEIVEEEAVVLTRNMLTAGLDTTVNGIGNAIHAFCLFPDQWEVLRANHALVRPAFDEAVRWSSPVQTFFRTATRDVQIEGVTIPESSKVLLFLGAANRDPRRFENPDRYDIRRVTQGHVGFGSGLHVCVGQMVARMEADAVLSAMAERVARIELIGKPERHLNNTLRALSRLPVRMIPA